MKKVLCTLSVLLFSALVVFGQNRKTLEKDLIQALNHSDFISARTCAEKLLSKYSHEMKPNELAETKISLASAYCMTGHEDIADSLIVEADYLMNEILPHNSKDYALWQMALYSTYLRIDRNKSINHLLSAIDVYENLEIEDTDYVNALLCLANAYNSQTMDNSATVERMLNRILPMALEVCGENSLTYNNALILAAENSNYRKKTDEALDYYDRAIKASTKLYDKESFYHYAIYGKRALLESKVGKESEAERDGMLYSEKLRTVFLNEYEKYESPELQSNMSYIQNWYLNDAVRVAANLNSTSYNSVCYDGVLWTKGLFLTIESGESSKKEVHSLQNLSWKKIQKKLKREDVAIEFVCYVNESWFNPIFQYYALVITPDCQSPELVDLGHIDGIKDEIQKVDITQKCQRYWQPLAAKLQGYKHIYFAPHGEIYRLPIEYFLPDQMSGAEAYRLSSTRELLKSNTARKNVENAAVFGGLVYDYLEVPTNQRLSSIQKRESASSFEYLPATETEAKEICESFMNKGVNTLQFTGTEGTEKAFKDLSNKPIDVIHIATHGYFYENPYNGIGIEIGSADRAQEGLVNSGIVMAGAGSYLNGLVNDCSEDGILNGKEIAELDLSKIELIALSACQSGLGKVSFEGVSGIQRGFKISGVKSLLMSLWSVDDEATCKLMTEFYANWINKKMTKYQALNAAVNTLKSDQDYQDPKYWAAFILLDAIN